MTIKEAENQYYREMENYENIMAQKKKQTIIICSIICVLFVIAGAILIIIGYNTPPEILTLGIESESLGARFEKVFGIIMIVITPFIALCTFLSYRISAMKVRCSHLWKIIGNLYSNYIRSEDIEEKDVEFYKQKLEDNRHRYTLPEPSEIILISKSRK